ncbi:MAG: hypothetical protein LBB76_05400, partial [Azoarcus sp.]|nr:hypothetical protein [Azoarcus sp.]
MPRNTDGRIDAVGAVDFERRLLLRGASALGVLGLAGGGFPAAALAAPESPTSRASLTPLRFAWNQVAFCSTPVA